MEANIKPLVKIDESYASYVDLKLELYDDNRNIHRMSHYRPVTSHRSAFEKLANSLRVMDKRTYFVTGAYGTGKSHLCLMLANYLQTPAGEKPMPEFFEHYDEVDEIAVVGAKEAFGTWALFDTTPRVVTATALSDAHLLRVEREEFVDLLAAHVQIAQGVLQTVASRLRRLVR